MADFDYTIPFDRAKSNILDDISKKYCPVISVKGLATAYGHATDFIIDTLENEIAVVSQYFDKITLLWCDDGNKDDMLEDISRYSFAHTFVEIGKSSNELTIEDRELMLNRCNLARSCVIEFWEQIYKYFKELREEV